MLTTWSPRGSKRHPDLRTTVRMTEEVSISEVLVELRYMALIIQAYRKLVMFAPPWRADYVVTVALKRWRDALTGSVPFRLPVVQQTYLARAFKVMCERTGTDVERRCRGLISVITTILAFSWRHWGRSLEDFSISDIPAQIRTPRPANMLGCACMTLYDFRNVYKVEVSIFMEVPVQLKLTLTVEATPSIWLMWQ
jgi:hypothetical protein